MNVAIRADGSTDLGFGHLVRTGALARELLERGHEVTYLTRTPVPAVEVVPDPAEVTPLDPDRERTDTVRWIEEHVPSVVLTDSFEIDTEYQQRLGSVAPYLVVTLDDTRYELACDACLNSNIYADSLEYEWVGAEPTWYCGTDYLLLREAFCERARETAPWRDTVRRALVTMGGSDADNRTPMVIRAFDETDLDVSVVIGPGFENLTEIRRAMSGTDASFDIVETPSPSEMADLMFSADLAVSTLGTTVYELFLTQTPIVGIPDNETPIDRELELRDAAIVLPSHPSVAEVAKAVRSLVENRERRRKLRKVGQDLVTPDGPRNLVAALQRTVE